MKTAIVVLFAALPALAAAGQDSTPFRSDPPTLQLRPGALAALIDEVGGHRVTLTRARIISILNPRAILVESNSSLEPTPGFYNRVVVLIDDGSIRVDRRLLVDSVVRITGVARTILGMQVTRDVVWPPELTPDVLRRYEIRAALLTASVQTADGVELVTPDVPDAETVRESR